MVILHEEAKKQTGRKSIFGFRNVRERKPKIII